MSDNITPAQPAADAPRAPINIRALLAVRHGFDARHRHALAALCLVDQPFGFTRTDVEFLRTSETHRVGCFLMAGGRLDAECDCDIDDRDARKASLIARIAALLPPPDGS
jgi:hypothetical protein